MWDGARVRLKLCPASPKIKLMHRHGCPGGSGPLANREAVKAADTKPVTGYSRIGPIVAAFGAGRWLTDG